MDKLVSTLQSKRAIVVMGPGGVGKTTVSAALALSTSQTGKQTLAVTVDPSLRLRDALGMQGRIGELETIPAGEGNLQALLLDTQTEMDRFVREYVKDPRIRTAIMSNIFYQKAAATAVGTHEYMAMIRLHDMVKSGSYDVVVTDTPPTEHAVDFLESPKRLARLLSHDSFRLAAGLMQRSGRGVLRLSGLVTRGLSRFVDLSSFYSLLDFVLSFGTLYDDLLEISRWFMEFIAGPQCGIVVVTQASRQRINDSIRFVQRLKDLGIQVDALVVNMVYRWQNRPPSGSVRSEVFSDLFSEPEVAFHSRDELNAAIYKVTLTLQWFEEVRLAQQAELDRLHQALPEMPIFVLPALQRDIQGPQDLLGLLVRGVAYKGRRIQ